MLTRDDGSRRNSLALAAFAGVWGGAFAGMLDAIFTLVRLADQISFARRFELLALGLALGAVMGLLLGMVSWLLAMLVSNVTGRWGHSKWSAAIWPTIIAAPLLHYGAFSAFSGPRAARLPGRFWLSCGLFVLGCIAVAVWGAFVARAIRQL